MRRPEKVALVKIGGGDVEMKVDGIRNRPIRVRAPAGHIETHCIIFTKMNEWMNSFLVDVANTVLMLPFEKG